MSYPSVIELRQYTLHPGRRDDLIELFDREFVATQEAVGIQVLGQFRTPVDPDRFVWLRGFPDMAARRQALTAFYDGPAWAEHRAAANATMIDSDDVLLLRPESGELSAGVRAWPGVYLATLCFLDHPVDAEFRALFRAEVAPMLAETGAPAPAAFSTEYAENTFPRLPVRTGEHAFGWLTRFSSMVALAGHESARVRTAAWTRLRARLRAEPTALPLLPTTGSALK
ncbi:NIPSNAP family protein [Crossiella cryophila]|uniref:Quinol monooxygenase YgiN n=1 Tax=Crossiella cryophila TaxID=43355 RepID=A0A7W7FXQ0_9PSEU|nr:NIPSNAP family protein [Crossiella cryophila]MBB4681320.1 quinol monooxygenase YgiN [Crossiella cryophila]